jgi:hypothetical protein
MTTWHAEYLVEHICALALVIDNFETDVNDLKDDLKLQTKMHVPLNHYSFSTDLALTLMQCCKLLQRTRVQSWSPDRGRSHEICYSKGGNAVSKDC